MDTRTAVIAQLRENTGAHMLDSGGAYGRGFERWAKVTDDTALSAPPVTVHPDYLTINTPQWLADRAEVQPKLTRAFRLWATLTDPEDSDSIPYTDHEDYEFALRCPCGMRMDVTRDEWQ